MQAEIFSASSFSKDDNVFDQRELKLAAGVLCQYIFALNGQ